MAVESFDATTLASREAASLSHTKVGQLVLSRSDATLQNARNNPLAVAARHGVICISDGDGKCSCCVRQLVHPQTYLQFGSACEVLNDSTFTALLLQVCMSVQPRV